jgi:precorrin-6B methylase 2
VLGAVAGTIAMIASLSLGVLAQEPRGVLAPENANEARLNRLQPPDQVMDAIGIQPGMVGAEIGAGRGRYVVQLAVRVDESGKIYAEDIDAEALRHLDRRCERWGLTNVESVLGDVTEPKLPPGELDFIFIISSYHHFADPTTLLRNARTALKPGGMLAIGEWLRSTSPEQLEAQVSAAGFRLERTETFLEANGMHIYVFRIDEARHRRPPAAIVLQSNLVRSIGCQLQRVFHRLACFDLLRLTTPLRTPRRAVHEVGEHGNLLMQRV